MYSYSDVNMSIPTKILLHFDPFLYFISYKFKVSINSALMSLHFDPFLYLFGHKDAKENEKATPLVCGTPFLENSEGMPLHQC